MLTKMGGAAFDLSRVVAVVRRSGWWPGKWEDRVTVFLCDAVSVELSGDDARAFLAFVESLPPHAGEDLGPLGSRVAAGGGPASEGGQRVRREERG